VQCHFLDWIPANNATAVRRPFLGINPDGGQVWEKIECAELEPEPEQLDLFK